MPAYIDVFLQPIRTPVAQTAIVGVILLILLDLLTGIVGALATHTFSSEKMRAGLLHKFTEMASLALGIILDGMLLGGLDLSMQPILIGTCAYVAIMEVGSFLELLRTYNPDAQGLVGFITQFVSPKGGDDA